LKNRAIVDSRRGPVISGRWPPPTDRSVVVDDEDKTVDDEQKVVVVEEVIVQEISEEKHADIIAEIINYTHWHVDGPQVYCSWRLKYPAKSNTSRS
jgi:hypothetical protein